MFILFSNLYFDIPRYADKLGVGYALFLTANSGSVLTTGILLLCYVTSTPTYNRVRPSLFVSISLCSTLCIYNFLQEVMFTAVCCFLYILSSTFLAASVYTHLYYYYHTMPGFSAYPALTAVYVRNINESTLMK